MAEQLNMFGDPEDKKRIAELEEELKNLKMAYDRLALMYENETKSTMQTTAKPGEAFKFTSISKIIFWHLNLVLIIFRISVIILIINF